ncbi:glycosyltransferase family 2 protein [bacterium]|nr:glycosyltransferase family 2 protein [bacterium]MCI0607108.1 glycosyltransferase family 2 protein [bacterium]
MKIILVLPARNEEENIGRMLDSICALYPQHPVLVVNDASTDGTAAIVQKYPAVSLIQLPFWMGYGGALQTAYKYAYRNGYEAVVQLDADGQHDPSCIQSLLDRIRDTDLVVGSRFLGGTEYKMPVIRRLGCSMLSQIGKRLTGMKITDPTSGFQALNRKALSIAIQDYYPMDYPDLDVLILMHRFRLKVMEIPVIMHPSEGKTGMHEGLQVWYYAFKMILSIFVMMLRKA